MRYENGGPLIGRFLVAPVPDTSGNLAGIVMLFRPMTAAAFNEEHLGQAAQLSRQLARLLSLPADPVTGLIGRGGIEKLVGWRMSASGDR